MIRALMIAAASAAVLALSPTAFAQQTGGSAAVDSIAGDAGSIHRMGEQGA